MIEVEPIKVSGKFAVEAIEVPKFEVLDREALGELTNGFRGLGSPHLEDRGDAKKSKACSPEVIVLSSDEEEEEIRGSRSAKGVVSSRSYLDEGGNDDVTEETLLMELDTARCAEGTSPSSLSSSSDLGSPQFSQHATKLGMDEIRRDRGRSPVVPPVTPSKSNAKGGSGRSDGHDLIPTTELPLFLDTNLMKHK